MPNAGLGTGVKLKPGSVSTVGVGSGVAVGEYVGTGADVGLLCGCFGLTNVG